MLWCKLTVQIVTALHSSYQSCQQRVANVLIACVSARWVCKCWCRCVTKKKNLFPHSCKSITLFDLQCFLELQYWNKYLFLGPRIITALTCKWSLYLPNYIPYIEWEKQGFAYHAHSNLSMYMQQVPKISKILQSSFCGQVLRRKGLNRMRKGEIENSNLFFSPPPSAYQPLFIGRFSKNYEWGHIPAFIFISKITVI